MIAPYLRNALWVFGASIALPLIGGVLARVFFLRRDPDDIALHRNDAQVHVAKSLLVSHEPEPDPVFQRPWSEERSEASAAAPASGAAPDSAIRVRRAPRAIREYRTARVDTAKVARHVERLWRKFVESPVKRRPEWTRYNSWSGAVPYQLAGAQGGSAEATTLSVSSRVDVNIPPEELAAIWDAEILPGLQREFGTRPFRFPVN